MVPDDGVKAIELDNGFIVYPPYNDFPTWKRVGDKIIINDRISIPVSRTRDVINECWSGKTGESITLDPGMFLSIILNKCPGAELVLKLDPITTI